MTRPSVRAGPPHQQGDASSFPSPSPTPSDASRGEAWVHTSTHVASAPRLLECSQIIRQNQFIHLVRRFLSQILHGCTAAHCTTPTCLSCNKRLVSRPFRAPTHLTARALAYYLASRDNPRRALCPHPLVVDPESIEIQDETGGILTWISQHEILHTHSITQPLHNTSSHVLHMKEAIRRRHQARKDPKSLGQNMYDTVAIIYSYSKHLPNPRSIFDMMRFYNDPLSIPDRALSPTSFTSSPAFNYANGDVASRAHVLDGADLDPSHSSHHRFGRSDSKQRSAEKLVNGQSVHKVLHEPDHKNNGCGAHKVPAASSLDGSLEIPHRQKNRPEMKMTSSPLPQPLPYTSSAPGSDDGKRASEKARLGPESPSTLKVTSHLTCNVLNEMKEDYQYHPNGRNTDLNYPVEYDSHRRHRPVKPFVNRSLFFTLSNPECLLKSFRDGSSTDYAESPLPHLDAYHLTNAFSDWDRRNGTLIFDSLYIALEALFRPPPELDTQKSPRLKPSRKAAAQTQSDGTSCSAEALASTDTKYLSNEEAAHIVMICVHALTALVPRGWPSTWAQLRVFRGWGVVIPGSSPQTDHTDSFINPWLRIVDELEYEPAIRLADRLLSGIGTRMCFEHILASLRHQQDSSPYDKPSLHSGSLSKILVKHLIVVERAALAHKARMKVDLHLKEDPGWTVTATWMEWLRTIIVKKYNGNGEVNKWGSVGAALILLKEFHLESDALNLRKNMFHIPYLNERMDTSQEPNKFLSWVEQPNTFHLLQLPFLFKNKYLVSYFRTINFARMFNQFQNSGRTTHLETRFDFFFRENHWQRIRSLLHATLEDFLRLDITRKNPLQETLDQLWGQEKRMLLKPLKVQIGAREGEFGYDQGGVTYEFFRLVLSKAFQAENGMFVIDHHTSMIWFHPAPLEPKWKYHMLGVLFSLAIYNGITLPVTFPLAFYAHLLGSDHPHMNVDKCSTDFIRDGWPALAKSFEDLLSYEGDVAETYMRDYAFSYEAYGQNFDIEMQGSRRGEPADANTPLVTNESRSQFVKHYITWLTNTSVEPQLNAFREGFRTCLHPVSLHLFDPESLRCLVEGNPVISVSLLRKHTRYENGYSATHATIRDFWAIVETFSQDNLKHLLEFVTANERVPITGYESMSFTIIRSGDDSELLPTSSTCFGKLMLPEYKGRAKMREKLRIALNYSKGFGAV
ncbi:hypothetical protein DM02DRAFT_618720 [Periconia macrospinosa]|uniref:HECT-type E3 ubiquitin transferase n=1 Tax=Periconia macrospinosa TaxID=97972 RepID=A0A2V1D8B2_9PLEO|nr:hypothetical protein DM02DRAFT_618720 [Periconia macrospinosa]